MIKVRRKHLGFALITIGALLFLADARLIMFANKNMTSGLDIVRTTTRTDDVYFNPHSDRPAGVSRLAVFGEPDSASLKRIRKETAPLLDDVRDDFQKTSVLREWVRKQASKTGLEISGYGYRRPEQYLDAMRRGVAVNCSTFAEVYLSALHANGFPARRIALYRDPPFDIWDSHATVEVFVGGKWVLQDPTFNVYWKVNEVPASARDIREFVQHRNDLDLTTTAASGGLLPNPSVNSYYKDPFILFNNVLYIYQIPESKRSVLRYPPFRLMKNNIVQLVGSEREVETSSFRINSYLVPFMFLWLPLLAFTLCLTGFFFVKKGR